MKNLIFIPGNPCVEQLYRPFLQDICILRKDLTTCFLTYPLDRPDLPSIHKYLVSKCRQILSDNPPEDCILMGHSLGCSIMMTVLKEFPQVKKSIFLMPFLSITGHSWPVIACFEFGTLRYKKWGLHLFNQSEDIQSLCFDSLPKVVSKRSKELVLQFSNNPPAILHYLKTLSTYEDLYNSFPRLDHWSSSLSGKNPLFVFAHKDPFVPLSVVRQLAPYGKVLLSKQWDHYFVLYPDEPLQIAREIHHYLSC